MVRQHSSDDETQLYDGSLRGDTGVLYSFLKMMSLTPRWNNIMVTQLNTTLDP